MKRDKASVNKLEELGWDVLVVWTCQVKDTENLKNKLFSFIEGQEDKNCQ